MLIFKSIKWKNFLSTGDKYLEFRLDESKTTLFLGDSGAGKSTICDALSFVLFNKPFRNIKKNQLINAINNKDCSIECEFSTGLKNYKVIRGMKPNIFEIYENGNLIIQDAKILDYQKYFETQILKFNYKSFIQIVILGAANFVPFMQLPAGDRRIIIEEMLNIQIFSKMADILKSKIVANKSKKVEKINQYNILKSEYEIHNDYKNKELARREETLSELKSTIKTDYDEHIRLKSIIEFIDADIKLFNDELIKLDYTKEENAIKLDIEKTNISINNIKKELATKLTNPALELEIVNNKDKIKKLEIKLSNRDNLKDSTISSEINVMHAEIEFENSCIKNLKPDSKIISQIYYNESKIKEYEKEILFYDDNHNCPTCNQEILASHKETVISDLKTTIGELQTQNLDLQNTKNQDLENKKIAIEEKIRVINVKIADKEKELLESIDKQIDDIKSEIDTLNTINLSIYEKIIIESEDTKTALEETLLNLNIVIDNLNIKLKSLSREAYDNVSSKLAEKQHERLGYNQQFIEISTSIKINADRVKKIESEPVKETKDLDKLKLDIENVHQNILELNEIESIYDISSSLLKDTGIKTRIIRQYLPSMNKLVNGFLQKMNFFVTFTFDENFDETIKSRGRDDFSYSCFSEGEKQRLDLALLFTWRAITKLKNSINTNLLLMDEIFDSYLDNTATENVIELIKSDMFSTSNIIVISHKNNIEEKFSKKIVFTKKNNFSIVQ